MTAEKQDTTPTDARQASENLQARIQRLEVENRELGDKAKLADSANKAKSDFLAMISHEIRTPMNGVIGLSELLLDTELNDKQQQFANLIRTSAQSLLTLINSLLDFSKIEADKMIIEKTAFNLAGLLEELVELYNLSESRKGVNVHLVMDKKLKGRFIGDESRIRQILVNLLGNAIKFTEQGKIEVQVTGETADDDRVQVHFAVIDTGIGIPEDRQGELFVPFSQVDTSSSRRFGGSGLGLSICAKLVELMDGEIGLHSVVGEGSTFWFTLLLPRAENLPEELPSDKPVQRDPLQLSLPAALPAAQSQEVLVVDDEETNRIVMVEAFAKGGLVPVVARSGFEACELCQSNAFRLIFMDCQMPVMDGYEATQKILDHCRCNNRVPPVIIALTADATTAARKRCREVGMTDYLVKPIDFQQIQTILRTFLQASYTGSIVADRKTSDSKTEADESQIINTMVLESLQENVGSLHRVGKIFLTSLRARCNELGVSVAERDARSIDKVAHTMKGSSSQFGAEQLTQLCAQMEAMGKNNNLEVVDQVYSEICAAVEDVENFLAAFLAN